MTAIMDKMKAKGVEPRDVRLNIAIAEFMNNGGSETRALALVRSAYERARQGQMLRADKANQMEPTPRAPNDSDKGQSIYADKAIDRAPAPSPHGSEGPAPIADKVTVNVPPASGRAAVMRAATNIARSVLDSFKVRDGRPIGDLAFCELENLRFDNAREAAVIQQIQRHYANAPGNALVRELIGEDDLNRFVQKAAEFAEF